MGGVAAAGRGVGGSLHMVAQGGRWPVSGQLASACAVRACAARRGEQLPLPCPTSAPGRWHRGMVGGGTLCPPMCAYHLAPFQIPQGYMTTPALEHAPSLEVISLQSKITSWYNLILQGRGYSFRLWSQINTWRLNRNFLSSTNQFNFSLLPLHCREGL